jgi:hypothetical protein
MFFALVRYSPMLRMKGVSPDSPSARIACGVLATGNSRSVARFTLLSVAWAESTTDTSNSNGV